MNKQGYRSDAPRICSIALGMIIAGGGLSASAVADTAFTWDPGAAVPSLGGPFAADAIDGMHYLYDVSPTAITPTDVYTVHFLEPITGFTLNGAAVATPGLNGTPGAPGSYGLYVTMENQTEAVGPPNNYNYLSGQIMLMLDPGNNDGRPVPRCRASVSPTPAPPARRMTSRWPPARWFRASSPSARHRGFAASVTSWRPSSRRLAKADSSRHSRMT